MARIAHNGYVQYGCGLCAPAGWTNFDASPTLRLQSIPALGGLLTRGGPRFPRTVRYGDVVAGLPIDPGSCRAVYCSHVLEHLALEDCRRALRNTFAILAPGGTFRFVLPDMEQLVRAYVADDDPEACHRLLRDARLGAETRPRGLRAFLRQWLGHSQHLWMWDFASMRHELEQAGFDAVRRARFGDAADPRFAEVEERGRWDDCLGVECLRPGAGAPGTARAAASEPVSAAAVEG